MLLFIKLKVVYYVTWARPDKEMLAKISYRIICYVKNENGIFLKKSSLGRFLQMRSLFD